MTTIAFDGRFLAADRRITFGTEISARAERKLDVAGAPPMAFASTGSIAEHWRAAFIAWWLGGHQGDLPPSYGADTEKAGNFIAVTADGDVQTVSYACPYAWRMGAPCAFGSGADFATGAMLAGRSAMEAVIIAAQCDTNTGGGVQFIDIQGLALGVRDWTTGAAPVALRGRRRRAA
jgi:hypothetical protein